MVFPVLQSVLTLALVVAAFGFMAWRLRHFAVLVNTGTRGDEDLTDRPNERRGKVFSHVLGHKKVLEEPVSGLLHLTFLYGFLILSIGHIEIVLEGLTAFRKAFGAQPFSYEWILPEGLNAVYRLSQDLLAAIVLVAASVALLRRWSGRVTRLMPRSQDAENILWFIVALYVSFFLLFGSTVLLQQRATGDLSAIPYQPFSSLVAAGLSGLGSGAVEGLQGVAWWTHVLAFLGLVTLVDIHSQPASVVFHDQGLIGGGADLHVDALAR